MTQETTERFFGYENAFNHPFTCGVVIAIAAVLLITPLIFTVVRNTVGISEATHQELWARWRSWIWISLALIIPILLGADAFIFGDLFNPGAARHSSRLNQKKVGEKKLSPKSKDVQSSRF